MRISLSHSKTLPRMPRWRMEYLKIRDARPLGGIIFQNFRARPRSLKINDTETLGSLPSFTLGTSVDSLCRFPEEYRHIWKDIASDFHVSFAQLSHFTCDKIWNIFGSYWDLCISYAWDNHRYNNPYTCIRIKITFNNLK